MIDPDRQLVADLRRLARPLTGSARDWDAVVERIGNASIVILGGATHGAHEVHALRAALTCRLVEELGFRAVALEADAAEVAAVTRALGDGLTDALDGFATFPRWAWRNTVVRDFADYRWGPLAPRDKVPSLVDETGSFPVDEPRQAYLARMSPDELEVEFRAQIEAVLAAGLRPTHLDWHCLRDGGRPDIFDLTLGLAGEYGLALRVFDATRIERLQRRGLPTADHEMVDSTRLETVGKTARYVRMLRELPAGLSEWAVHPALGTAEAQAIDGKWAGRAADLAFLVSQEARETTAAEGIILLDYRPLQESWGRDR
jgi:predicted glycoside hydrolase/deacetylase ChbG (UPF0249 family)